VKYLLQLYQNTTREDFDAMSEEERRAIYAEWAALREAPGVTPGLELAPAASATTVRVRDGRTLRTDGPFAETKEALGGYFLLEAENLDAAIEIAALVPTASHGGAVEIRPIVEH
jgi:hypothetical protein